MIGDCPFAAAADWEIIALGIEPSEAEVIADWTEANGDLWDWWEEHGIAGVRISGAGTISRESLSRAALLSVVNEHAVLATLYDPEAQTAHDVLVDGHTPTGPVIVTWAQTWQLT